MRRVVVTGIGIVSSIGKNRFEVLNSLKYGSSGLEFSEEYRQMGLRSQVYGPLRVNISECIDRKILRFMGNAAAYAYIAMCEAIADAKLTTEFVSNTRSGLIIGTGGASPENIVEAADLLRNKGLKKVGPYMVPRTMSSTVTACLATPFKIKGISYSISSACASSAHCIGHGAELIQFGKQDIIFAGGGEEVHWSLSHLFDAMGALSTKYNTTPQSASRTYDINRDGFVISGGGGILVLEELTHAQKRGAKIYAELTGYGATSDGNDMVQPSGEGALRCMQQALLLHNDNIDYINTHGTSTLAGDIRELEAIKGVFDNNIPLISSTKPLTGHSLGAAGVHEAIYSLLMMDNNFVSASANIDQIDPAAKNFPIVRETINNINLRFVMSNSFGFGGTNATLIFKKYIS